jgi:hypothetical protein
MTTKSRNERLNKQTSAFRVCSRRRAHVPSQTGIGGLLLGRRRAMELPFPRRFSRGYGTGYGHNGSPNRDPVVAFSARSDAGLRSQILPRAPLNFSCPVTPDDCLRRTVNSGVSEPLAASAQSGNRRFQCVRYVRFVSHYLRWPWHVGFASKPRVQFFRIGHAEPTFPPYRHTIGCPALRCARWDS